MPSFKPFIETDATGKVTIKGLKEGTYYLAETKAPAGFNKLVGDIKVEIGNLVYDTTDTTKLNSYDVTYTMPGATSSSIKVTVPTGRNSGTEQGWLHSSEHRWYGYCCVYHRRCSDYRSDAGKQPGKQETQTF